MQLPEMLDNVSKTVKDDLTVTIKKGDKLSVAAACFSIYAYQVLKKQLDGIAELRFIFTSPTFLQEKAPKATPHNSPDNTPDAIDSPKSVALC